MRQGQIIFNNFSRYPDLFYAISSRSNGSMKDNNVLNYSRINKFIRNYNINPHKLFLSEQTHSANVTVVSSNSKNSYLKNTDALFTNSPNTYLGIVTADCLPILLFDCKKSIVGIIHGGYKGISKLIINNTINKFKYLGSNIDTDLLISIGPGIGVCCYEVSSDRVELFKKIFPSYKNLYQYKNNKYYLDLKKITFQNLIENGITPKNIEISNICTACDADKFYSYRKEGQKAGRFLSIIGIGK